MILAHKIALDATMKQRRYFSNAAGCDRFVWNLALEQWNAEYAAGKKPRATELKKRFNATKYQQYPWMKEIHRDAHADPFARLQKAWVAFFKNPKQSKPPRFHKKGRKDSFYVANDKFEIEKLTNGRGRVRLPVIGWVYMREALRFNGKIMGARVLRQAQRWFIAIQVEVEKFEKPRIKNDICGVDLGIKNAAIVARDDGSFEEIPAPKPLAKALSNLRRMQRSVSRRQKGGSNRRKLVARVARLHARVSNIRSDFWHKVTTRLCSESQAVGIESLNVRGMVKNRRLSRALVDVAIGMFAPLMGYKSKMYNTRLVAADQWYASSKTCSRCGAVKAVLGLGDRVFRCDACGAVKDRDRNASSNLLASAKRILPAACGEVTPGESSARKAAR